MKTQGQNSIGVLILFIAALFTAAIVASVLITSSGSLQNSALKTGNEVQHESSSGFFIMDITAEDGSDGSVNIFKQIIKMHPGSPPMDLSFITLVFGTENITSSLEYRGVGATTDNSNLGYNTFLAEELGEAGRYYELIDSVVTDVTPTALDMDVDMDALVDTIVVCRDGRPHCPNKPAGSSGKYVGINVSSVGMIYVPLLTASGALINLQIKNGEIFANFLTPIGQYAYLTTSGSENGVGGYQIPANRMRLIRVPIPLREDLDEDQQDDTLVINNTHVIVHYSSKGNISIQLNKTMGVAYGTGYNLGSGAQALDTTLTLTDNESSQSFGTLTLQGSTTRAHYIDEDVTFLVTPLRLYKGYYSVDYIQRGPNYQEGIISPGDSLRVLYEAPRDIHEDEELRITLIPRKGSVTLAEFYMPNIISERVIHVYP